MKLSCAFATSVDTPDHVAVAESLGYRRAWLYDSPAIYPDVWMALALAADRTSTIGVGPGVLIPSLRHPMVNAGAIAALEALAPGRVAIGIGAGFTGRYTMGQKPLRWADVGRYVEVLRALLRGDVIEWEGAAVKMLHGPGFGAERPIDVPIFIGAGGPVGTEVALRVGDGIMAAGAPNTVAPAGTEQVLLQFGTVLSEGEDLRSRRVLDAAGHALAVGFHARYERGGVAALSGMPGGEAWAAAVAAIPETERHLATHEGHLVRLAAIDEAAITEAADLIPAMSFSGTAGHLNDRVRGLAAAGVTEIAYQPAGPDIPGELERMADALDSVTD
jgi:5,10-methylenetetrahydromethanopterin reductase